MASGTPQFSRKEIDKMKKMLETIADGGAYGHYKDMGTKKGKTPVEKAGGGMVMKKKKGYAQGGRISKRELELVKNMIKKPKGSKKKTGLSKVDREFESARKKYDAATPVKKAGGGMAMKKKKGYAKGGAAMKKKKGYARGGAVRRK